MNYQCMECGEIIDSRQTHTLLHCVRFLKAKLEELENTKEAEK